jgi:hypothetical protein
LANPGAFNLFDSYGIVSNRQQSTSIPCFNLLDKFYEHYFILVVFHAIDMKRAEIIHQALSQTISERSKVRPIYYIVNVLCYLTLIGLLIGVEVGDAAAAPILDITLNAFLALLFFVLSVACILYGGKLYQMLKKTPFRSPGRSSKLKEV